MANPKSYNLGLLFSNVAHQHAQNEALRYAEISLKYLELENLSNQIAHYLIDKGIGRGDVIAFFHNKSTSAFAAMLACLKVGAPYVNLDITSPPERLSKIIGTCQPEIFINDLPAPPDENNIDKKQIIDIQDVSTQRAIGQYPKTLPLSTYSITGIDAAYVMFTSGSTGFPKGAAMSHQNVMHFIHWGEATYEITAHDVFTNINPLYFDNSVFDFYMSLFHGATLAPFSYETIKNPRDTVDYANQINPTIWFTVPSMLVYLLTTRSFEETDLPNLRIFTFGGEGFPKPKLKQLYEMFGQRVRFVNVYGPTECTCMCSSYDITENDFEDLSKLAPLGKIAPNFKAVIVADEEDDTGELCLGGPHVGLGYYNDPERTAKSFIQNPENKYLKEIIYKTGDLVRREKDGTLHFLGRVDNQIKHMGYRIELEEIEAAFNTLSYVNECGVVYKKLPVGGQIMAYVSLNAQKEREAIHADIKKILPAYMLPKSIRTLDHLPKNQNGKIDRVKLKEKG